MVGDLLALASSEEQAEPQSSSLGSAASAAAGRWRDPADESGHELVVSGDGEVLVGAGERDLALILDNLLENALKYSPRGSTVEIGWEGGERDAALRVHNAGGPLAEEESERAFERFYRGRAASGAPVPVWACRSWRRWHAVPAVTHGCETLTATGSSPRWCCPSAGHPGLCRLLTRPI